MRRRQRVRVIRIGVAVAAMAVVALLWWSQGDDNSGSQGDDNSGDVAASIAPPSNGAAQTTIVSAAPVTTIEPARAVLLEEVWLLDRGDGSFDWGLTVVGGDDGARESVEVTVRLLGAGGDPAFTETAVIALLTAGQRIAVGGVAADTESAPIRIEADVAVGQPAPAGTGEVPVLSLRAVERRDDVRSGDGGEVLTGRLRSNVSVAVEDVVIGAIWRDEEGAVVAAIFYDVAEVRPGVDARFEIDLDGPAIPDGPPAEVLWFS